MIHEVSERQILFADGTFDVIVSSLVLHNIHGQAERDAAVRALKSGGRVALLDVTHTKVYTQMLIDSGIANARRSRPQLLFFMPARIVAGRNPARAALTLCAARPGA